MSTLSNGIGRWARDAAERAARAAVATFTATMLGASLFSVDGVVDVSLLQRAGMAAIASAVSVVLSLGAKWAGDPSSASLRPGD